MQAKVLGADLQEADNMYKDLQELYLKGPSSSNPDEAPSTQTTDLKSSLKEQPSNGNKTVQNLVCQAYYNIQLAIVYDCKGKGTI